MVAFLDRFSRSRRVKKELEKFAKAENIVLDKHEPTWVSSSNGICVIVDVGSLYWPRSRDLVSPITDFVRRRSLSGDERFFVLLADLDKKNDLRTAMAEMNSIVDPAPHIFVYSMCQNVDVRSLLEELANRTLSLIGGFYGPCRAKFNCYTKSKYLFSEKTESLSTYGSLMTRRNDECSNNDGLIFTLFAITTLLD